MSKRDGDTSVKDFIDSGYLRDALINFIALLGWNSGSEQEIYTLDELIKQFTLDNVHKAGAVFDVDKFDWINGIYIRQLSADAFLAACLPYLTAANLITEVKTAYVVNETGEKLKEKDLKKILAIEQQRIKKLSEIPAAVDYLMKDNLNIDAKALVWKKSTAELTISNLKQIESVLKDIDDDNFGEKEIEKQVRAFLDTNNIETGDLLWPMRYALSGKEKSPGPFELASTLGKEKTLKRINSAITTLL